MQPDLPRVKLVVGLGNPGARYAKTRHNAGHWLVAALAEKLSATFAAKTRWRGQCAEDPETGIRIFRPDSFMNESGRPVALAAKYCGASPAEILVAHDEVDLPPGAVKLKRGGGEAGHNGLRDISAALGARDYWRLRIGVGKPQPGTDDVADFVLRAPSPEERAQIDSAVARALNIWSDLAAGDFARATLALHTREKKSQNKPPAREVSENKSAQANPPQTNSPQPESES